MILRAPSATLFPYTTLFRSISSRKKVSTDHLQTVAAGAVASQHQSCRFQGLLDHWDLALVQLEIDDLPGLGLSSGQLLDRKSTRLNSSHPSISYAVFCLKKK